MPLTSFLVEILLPPASLAWIGLAFLLFSRRRRGRRLAVGAFVLLAVLSLPLVGQVMIRSLEQDPDVTADPRTAASAGPAQPGAIVILSGDAAATTSPPFWEVGALTLERERAGAVLHRATGLPVLVTGGSLGAGPALGTLMANSMAGDFGITVEWKELRSRTTWENAQFSAPILKAAGITRVYLVTHAWHMRRSLLAFRRAGIDAVSAPVRLDPVSPVSATDLIPRASGWIRSYYAIHEWVGLLFYTWRR